MPDDAHVKVWLALGAGGPSARAIELDSRLAAALSLSLRRGPSRSVPGVGKRAAFPATSARLNHRDRKSRRRILRPQDYTVAALAKLLHLQ